MANQVGEGILTSDNVYYKPNGDIVSIDSGSKIEIPKEPESGVKIVSSNDSQLNISVP